MMDQRIRDAANSLEKFGDLASYIASISRYLSDISFDPKAQANVTCTLGYELCLYRYTYNGDLIITSPDFEGFKKDVQNNWQSVRTFITKSGDITEFKPPMRISLYRIPLLCLNGYVYEPSGSGAFERRKNAAAIPFPVLKNFLKELFKSKLDDIERNHKLSIEERKAKDKRVREEMERREANERRYNDIKEIKDALADGDIVTAEKIIEYSIDPEIKRIGPFVIRDYNKGRIT